ncbi:hypothetical protein BDZ97DRAFT_1104801 [Flammula alnicola]|nr:hypothetical protein BDZ97DRAFT_1104801 [Flammula alnicola]
MLRFFKKIIFLRCSLGLLLGALGTRLRRPNLPICYLPPTFMGHLLSRPSACLVLCPLPTSDLAKIRPSVMPYACASPCLFFDYSSCIPRSTFIHSIQIQRLPSKIIAKNRCVLHSIKLLILIIRDQGNTQQTFHLDKCTVLQNNQRRAWYKAAGPFFFQILMPTPSAEYLHQDK